MDKHSYLSAADLAQVEQYYQQYLQNSEQLDESWRKFFEGFEFSRTHFPLKNSSSDTIPDEFKVVNLINAYRERGHLFTLTNPVRTRRKYLPTLDLENFDLTQADLEKEFHAGHKLGIGKAKLKDIIAHLQTTYCRTIGVEYRYIRNPKITDWLRSRMESTRNLPVFTLEFKKQILQKLSEAVLFEKFIHKKFPGQKRFSLEGAEALIPALDAIIEKGASVGIEEFVIGMPHRGRLNVLANILHKSYNQIFSEFQGREFDDEAVLGDVKYHLGYTSYTQTSDGKNVRLSLSPNPSHLETVSPVVEGIVRNRIDHHYKGDFNKIVPILIHGDASIAGQGIVYEVIQMSDLPGYKTGGTVHLIVNNQLGFTTNYLDARTSTYCTDVAKTIQSPIFHVNADDVEAVVYTIQLAMEFREIFHRDVFVDLLGYRKYGHNEGDEPRFTQPILYKTIERHPNPREIYIEKLKQEGLLEVSDAKQIETLFNELLEKELDDTKNIEKAKVTSFLEADWKGIRRATPKDFESSPDTSLSKEILDKLANVISSYPTDKKIFAKIIKLQDERRKLWFDKGMADWAIGELLAYGSILNEGKMVRLSGQDVCRGTFSHRHAVLMVEDSEETYIPLENISDKQGGFEVYNSLLSEYGVLGFDYGYAMASPENLVIWEAQFGDFFNGAQIIIDQFISSAEEKWNVMNGVVMLLPHGFEGQGPEHSSARIERFLQLCAENNIQIVNCTTPANFFHLLRRQQHREIRKPLVVFTPKSLLRHPACISPVSDFTTGGFKEVIGDVQVDKSRVESLVFVTGKLYYDLLSEREKTGKLDRAIIRIEQLHPFPQIQLQKIISQYPNAKYFLWVQEEPANMGAWAYMRDKFKTLAPLTLFACRPASGSPATGSGITHKLQQQRIIDKVFGRCTCEWANEECEMQCVEIKE